MTRRRAVSPRGRPASALLLLVLLPLAVAGIPPSAPAAVHHASAPPTAASRPPVPPVPCTAFAAPDGSDQGTGSRLDPLRTVRQLLLRLPRGGTGCLRSGTYAGDVTVPRGALTLRSAAGERAVLSLGSLRVPAETPDVTIRDLDIAGTPGGLTVDVIGDRFTLQDNDISNGNRGRSCILVGASDHRTTGGTVRDNVIHDCGRSGDKFAHGIYAQNVGAAEGVPTGLLITGNVFYAIASYALQLYPRASDVVVLENVLDGGGPSIAGGIVIDGPGAAKVLIKDNVIARTRTGAVMQRTGTGHTAEGNCLWDDAAGVLGTGITRTGNRSADSCWLPPSLWAATGRRAAQVACACPARRAARCSASEADALCRLLHDTPVPTA
jgi:hypothetical protein